MNNRNANIDTLNKMVELTHFAMALFYVPICLGLAFLLVNIIPPFGLNSDIFPEEVVAVDCLAFQEFTTYFSPIHKETLGFVTSAINSRSVQPEIYILISDLTRDVLHVTTTYQNIGNTGREANAWMNKAKFILYMTDVQQSANAPKWEDVDRDYGELINDVELFTANATCIR